MYCFMNRILKEFRKCFSREKAFNWLVVIVVGLMVRSDHMGVTSIIRELAIRPELYESMLHFFRAASWGLAQVRQSWYETVKANAPICREGVWNILIGDGVKQSKEARHMPGVKKLFQESEDSSKPAYIFGHMFGGLGILIGNETKKFCLPLSIRLHDGLQFLSDWEGSDDSAKTHVVQMVEDAYEAAKTFGNSLLLLDRYFLSVPALTRLAELNASQSARLEIVTKAKQNCVAFKQPVKKSGRGRPPKKGEKVRLKDIFSTDSSHFTKAELELYGKRKQVEYLCVDLLWGQKLYQILRFVLVKYEGTQSILVSTCLDLEPEAIIRLYSRRFRIEGCFRELKQQIGGFGYHFWTRAMPKLNHFSKKGTSDPLGKISDDKLRTAVCDTVQAVEGFVMFSCIAMGLLQVLSLQFSDSLNLPDFRYLRTRSSCIASEGTTMCFLRRNLFRFIALHPDLTISRIILGKSDTSALFRVA